MENSINRVLNHKKKRTKKNTHHKTLKKKNLNHLFLSRAAATSPLGTAAAPTIFPSSLISPVSTQTPASPHPQPFLCLVSPQSALDPHSPLLSVVLYFLDKQPLTTATLFFDSPCSLLPFSNRDRASIPATTTPTTAPLQPTTDHHCRPLAQADLPTLLPASSSASLLPADR